MGRIWLVCSGSGGVGKTTLALSLSAGAAREGKRVILLDACGISRACDLALGIESMVVLDLMDVASGEAELSAALYAVPANPNLRFACTSLYRETGAEEFAGIILALKNLCDVLVIDLPTGESSLGRGMLNENDRRLIVLRPDDASIRSVERLMAMSARDAASTELILNNVSRELLRSGAQYPANTVQALLDMPILGSIPADSAVTEIIKRKKSLISFGGAKSALSKLVTDMLKTL